MVKCGGGGGNIYKKYEHMVMCRNSIQENKDIYESMENKAKKC